MNFVLNNCFVQNKTEENKNEVIEFTVNETTVVLLNFILNDHIKNTFLFEEEQSALAQIKNEIKKLEFYAVRYLRNFKQINLPISYNANGAPFFKGSTSKISISHSKELAVIALSTARVGVDIELITERIVGIKDRFISAEELNLFKVKNAKTYTIIWTIKEVIYKLSDLKHSNFLADMKLLEQSEGIVTCQFKTSEGIRFVKIKFQELGNYIISFNPSIAYEIDNL